MLEKKNDPAYKKVSKANQQTVKYITQIIESAQAQDKSYHINIAEIGVGVGATSLEICKHLQGKGTLHIFDYDDVVTPLKDDLAKEGFEDVLAYGNTHKTWDSYHWPLMKILMSVGKPCFDYVFLDGSHALLHEAAAFAIIDRLLNPGGFLDLDDYNWSYEDSKLWSPDEKNWVREAMTEEQIKTSQVQLLVDYIIKPSMFYQEIVPNKLYKKRQINMQS